MIAVLAVTDGTDGEDDLDVGTTAAKEVDSTEQVVGTLVDRQFFLLEKDCRPLLTVVDNLARLTEAVDVVGTEGEECYSGGSFVAFHRVQDAGGIVHHAIRVDGGSELVLYEPLANAIGKARAYEKYLFAGLYLKAGLWYVDDCSEIHRYI